MAFITSADPSLDMSSAEERCQRYIKNFACFQIFSVIFLEKLALHIGDGEVQMVLPIFLASLVVLSLYVEVHLDRLRALAYAGFIFTVLLAHITLTEFSVSSIVLVFVTYVGMCFYTKANDDTYVRCLRFHNGCVLIICILTMYQFISQYTIGNQYWGNLEKVIPESLLFSGYNYLQPVRYLSPYFKPNAIFMLEVSEISQFSALALMIEIAYFRRPLFLLAYASAIMLTFSGTGLLVLLFCIPALLGNMSPRLILMGMVALGGALVAASLVGWSDEVGSRVLEFTTPGTSGYYRFTIPVLLFGEIIVDPTFFFAGTGAGTTLKGTVYLLLPFAKVISEYGTLSFFSFYFFLIVTLFRAPPSWTVVYTAFVLYNLAGSTLGMPMYAIILISLGCFFRIAPAAGQAPQAWPSHAIRRARLGT